MGASHGWTTFWGMNPYERGLEVIDCGDVCFFFSVMF